MFQGHKQFILSLLPALLICSCADVKTVSPARKNIVTTVYASGEIVPENEHWISSEKSGTLLKKCVKDGDTVKTGQVLYVIRDETAEAKIDAATANYTLSSLNVSDNSPVLADIKLEMMAADTKFANDSTNYQRWKNLWEHGIGTKSNLDNAYTQYAISFNEKKIATQRYLTKLGELNVSKKMAQSQLSNIKKEFADGFIVSDQPGIVYETLKDAGENVAVNEKLLLIGNCVDRIIKLYVDQQDISKVKHSQKVLVQADQSPDEVYEARITFIYPSMNRTDQTFCVEAKFDQHPPYSFIHTPVEANIVIDERREVLVVPKEVLAGKDSLWIKDNKRYRKVLVKTGVASFDYVEVVSGVNENNAVILDWYKLN
jgi:RND family efflux transporter MFP subunit